MDANILYESTRITLRLYYEMEALHFQEKYLQFMVSDYFQLQFLSASSPLLWLYLCLAVMCMSIAVDPGLV